MRIPASDDLGRFGNSGARYIDQLLGSHYVSPEEESAFFANDEEPPELFELHVPIADGADGTLHWISSTQEALDGAGGPNGPISWDDGEECHCDEHGEEYVYYLYNAEPDFLVDASRNALQETGAPPGAYAILVSQQDETCLARFQVW